MKKLILSLVFVASALATFAQSGAQQFSGVFYRVNDSTAYQTAAAAKHSLGYSDIYFNNQATTPHFDVWNGSSYDHIFNFASGGGAALTEGEAINIIGDSINVGGRHYNDINIGHATEGANFKITEGDGSTTQVFEVKKGEAIVASASDGTDFSHLSIGITQILLSTGASHSGIGYSSDLSATIGANDLTQKTYVDNHIAGQDVDGNVTTPSSGEDGYVMSWDETSGTYKLVPDAGGLTIEDLMESRTLTSAGATVQGDNLNKIYLNSATPFNLTVDQLTIGSQVTLLNIGTATVNFINGSGVTYTGSTTIPGGQTGVIDYVSATAPTIYAGSSVPTATSSISGTVKLYTTLGSNTDGAIDQNSANTLLWKTTGTTTVGTPSIAQTVTTSGATKLLTVTGAAHTGQTASTEVIDLDFDNSATLQHATGAITTQRSVMFRPRTYSFVGSSTISNAITVYAQPPIAGTNATLTNRLTFFADGGVSQFGATVQSGYTGSLVATVNANNRVAMLGSFEFVNSGGPSYSGVGLSVPGSNRTVTYYGGTLANAGDFASNVWVANSYGTARAGTSLSNVNITVPAANASVFTATDYSLLKLDGAYPTLTTPLTTYYGISIIPSAAGNATTNIAINTNANAGRVNFGSHVQFAGALMPNNDAGTSGQVLESAGSGAVPVWAAKGTETVASGTQAKVTQVSGATTRRTYEMLWYDGAAVSGDQTQILFTGNDATATVVFTVTAIKSDGSESYGGQYAATYMKDGAAAIAQVGTTTMIYEHKTDAGASFVADVFSSLPHVEFDSGDADSYRWTIWAKVTVTQL